VRRQKREEASKFVARIQETTADSCINRKHIVIVVNFSPTIPVS
jgi:hypothetical protein